MMGTGCALVSLLAPPITVFLLMCNAADSFLNSQSNYAFRSQSLRLTHQRQDRSPFTKKYLEDTSSRLIFRDNIYKRSRCTSLRVAESWLPSRVDYDDDIFAVDDEREELEKLSLEYIATLIKIQLYDEPPKTVNANVSELVNNKFADLCCTHDGELALENLFTLEAPPQASTSISESDIISGAIIALHSLLIMGMQAGVRGTPTQLERMFEHLLTQRKSGGNNGSERDPINYTRKLKYDRDTTAGIQILALLKRKRNAQGAFDLLVSLGAWNKHEDLALLRSGFPTRFTDKEEEAANKAENNVRDPDSLLGLRKDLRKLKVYTIDAASTSEIDDGLSVQAFTDKDGALRQRFWIHIADADKWAPRGSEVIQTAQRRVTSLYLPMGSVPMFPSRLSVGCMSLKANHDTCALSLGVEILPDGAIDVSSIILVPSLIRVTYRLTYDSADEMLEEGVGYSEEWQLGALLSAATRRRTHRAKNGSTEGLVRVQIPQGSVNVQKDPSKEDGLAISLSIEDSNNSGANSTSGAAGYVSLSSSSSPLPYAPPLSASNLLVTEMMIMAGEAMGKWGMGIGEGFELPYRCQVKPDFLGRQQEANNLSLLKESNKGNGYCAAWYLRRFLRPVQVKKESLPHAGMGLECYVQWTSPIRRYSDLQVHAAVKRHLRRKRVDEMITTGIPIPPQITATDLGGPISQPPDSDNETNSKQISVAHNGQDEAPINFLEGQGLVRAARQLQRRSQEYWVFEYIKRQMKDFAPGDELVFECTVLGVINLDRMQYAIYINELGLEHRYLSEKGELKEGQTLLLKVADVNSRMGLLTLNWTAGSNGGSRARAA